MDDNTRLILEHAPKLPPRWEDSPDGPPADGSVAHLADEMRRRLYPDAALFPPDAIVFVGGKKRAGKDFVCDQLVARVGFHKFHIVSPWLAGFRARHGITEGEYERDKPKWRPLVQEEATAARAKDPDCLIRAFRDALPTLPRPLCVTAVRFVNEARLGIDVGACVVKVSAPDDVRRQRFLDAGESLDLFDDPFEAEVDRMPVHLSVPGTLPGDWYVKYIAGFVAAGGCK